MLEGHRTSDIGHRTSFRENRRETTPGPYGTQRPEVLVTEGDHNQRGVNDGISTRHTEMDMDTGRGLSSDISHSFLLYLLSSNTCTPLTNEPRPLLLLAQRSDPLSPVLLVFSIPKGFRSINFLS